MKCMLYNISQPSRLSLWYWSASQLRAWPQTGPPYPTDHLGRLFRPSHGKGHRDGHGGSRGIALNLKLCTWYLYIVCLCYERDNERYSSPAPRANSGLKATMRSKAKIQEPSWHRIYYRLNPISASLPQWSFAASSALTSPTHLDALIETQALLAERTVPILSLLLSPL